MNAVKGAESVASRNKVQNDSFHARMTFSKTVDTIPGMDNGNRILMISSQSLAPSIRAGGLQDIFVDFGEIGVEHPYDDW